MATINGNNRNNTLNGDTDANDLNDLINARGGNDRVNAGQGNDTIYGGTGNDTLNGQDGDDIAYGEAGADRLFGGAGNDTLDGGTENDSLDGGEGNDLLLGGAGTDTLLGANGDDTLDGGAGDDTINGGAGRDTVTYAAETAGVNVNLNTGSASGTTSGSDSLISVENVIGTAQNDTITGSNDANLIDAGAGDDQVDTGAGNDTVFGGAGNDTLVMGSDDGAVFATETQQLTYNLIELGTFADVDADESDGGLSENAGALSITHGSVNDPLSNHIVRATAVDLNGDDTLSDNDGGATSEYFLIDGQQAFLDSTQVYNATVTFADGSSGTFSAVVIQMTDGRVFLAPEFEANPDSALLTSGPITSITLGDVNNADSGLYATRLDSGYFGTNDSDLAYGGDGDDVIEGGLGDDTLSGEAGNDSVSGGVGNDSLSGGIGSDTLDGGAGDDFVDGGDDADLIQGGEGNDTINFGAGDDTVFGGAGDDVIDDLPGQILPGTNVIDAGDGNDTVWSGGGDDTILGGLGDDLIHGEDDNDLLSGDDGQDTLFGGVGNDTLSGGDGADSLDGGLGDDSLDGGSGNDTLLGGAGNDTLIASNGTGDMLIDGGDGRDSIILGAGFLGSVTGGGGGDDFDTLDLRAFGKDNTNIIFGGPENGTVQFLNPDGSVAGEITFSDIEDVIPCFTPGTWITTPRGPRLVQDLQVGDLVLTRDSGVQPIRWVGRRDLQAVDLLVKPALRPVLIAKGALGAGQPCRDMLVSPQHRLLVEGSLPEFLFGETEVLVAALHLVGRPGISRVVPRGVSYIHVMCDQHEIVQADGCWTESFQPGGTTLAGMAAAQRAEVLALFPELADDPLSYPAARATLKSHEVQVLFAA